MLKFKYQKQTGVTLVELLIAITILAIIAVLGWKGLDSIIFSEDKLSKDIDDVRNLQLIFAQLQTDCAQLSKPKLINGRSPIFIDNKSLIITRDTVSIDGIPGVQIVKYHFNNGKLTRSASSPTRSIRQLHQYWLGDQLANNDKAVLLHANLESINIRLWNKNLKAWQSVNQSKSTTSNDDVSNSGEKIWNYNWSGLAFDIQLTNRKSTITKIVSLGPS